MMMMMMLMMMMMMMMMWYCRDAKDIDDDIADAASVTATSSLEVIAQLFSVCQSSDLVNSLVWVVKLARCCSRLST